MASQQPKTPAINGTLIEKALRQRPFRHRSSVCVGRCRLGAGTSVWPFASIRADVGSIDIGKGVNIQDGVVMHTEFGGTLSIGDYSLIAHRAVLHGCHIGRCAMVGTQSVVLDDAIIGDGACVMAGVIIRGKKKIPPFSLVIGTGDKIKILPNRSPSREILFASIQYAVMAYFYKKKIYTIDFDPKAKELIDQKARELYDQLFS